MKIIKQKQKPYRNGSNKHSGRFYFFWFTRMRARLKEGRLLNFQGHCSHRYFQKSPVQVGLKGNGCTFYLKKMLTSW